MNGSWKRAAAASALCLGIAAAGLAGAQDRPQGPPPGAGQRGPGRPGFDGRKFVEEMRQRREQRMHDLLQIKPNQEAAFHAFTAAMQPPPRDGKPGGPGGPGRERGRGPEAARPQAAPMTTPERLDRMQMRMAERQARFQQTAAAIRTFYAALSPEQRKAFDVMPMMGGEHGGHRGGGRFGSGRPGFGGPR